MGIFRCNRCGMIYDGVEGICKYCGPPPPPEPEVIVIGGLDLGKIHDYSALVVLEIQDQKVKVKGLKPWPHVDYSVVVKEVAELYTRLEMEFLAVDATGVGEAVREMLAEAGVRTEDIKFGEYVETTNILGEHERAPIKYAMVEYTRACLQAGRVSFGSGCEDLIRQLRELEMVLGAWEHPKYEHPEGSHDDLAWAFMMALYAGRRWITGGGGWVVRIN